MNSRSSVNETNLVNFSADLTTLNQLETKDGLLSFPFDHIYACHSESSDRRPTLTLDKEVEITTHCVVAENKELVVSSGPDVTRLAEQLSASESQNKRLKDLLVYHLDLIQQQNEVITKREKLYQALKQENDTLKSKLSRMDRRLTVNQRHFANPPPLVHVPSSSVSTVTSTIVKSEPSPPSQIMLNSFTELLLTDNRTNSFIFESDINKTKPFNQEPFEISRTSESDVISYLPDNIGVPTILDANINSEDFTMIENKRSFVKKEIKTENRPEPLYTVTSNSGNPVIQRIQRNRRRTTSGISSLNRMSKSPAAKVEPLESAKVLEEDKGFERNYSVNKKSKMINTYGKSKTNFKRTTQFTGSLSDRLQLIDTTPTGEDPYQLGEADMREQSPIPKLMLQKTNHGRMKICTETMGEGPASRRIYDAPAAEDTTKAPNRIKTDRYNLSNTTYMHPSEIKKENSPKTLIVVEPDLNIVKTEPEIDWRMYNPNKAGNETSISDFSYGENSNNLATNITLDAVEFQDLFSSESSLNLENLTPVEYCPSTSTDKSAADKSKRRAARTTSLVGPNTSGEEAATSKRGAESKRGRKRALSTGLLKTKRETPHTQTQPQTQTQTVTQPQTQTQTQPEAQNLTANETQTKGPAILPPKPKLVKGKSACRGKKLPLPGMVTKKPYHTLVGDPDISWYLGLDPEVKPEDVDPPADSKVATVEVPRWREKPYTSCYTLEGTENLDDKVFEKRHQKLEAEERRQLRWHMRRIREQRHVERLRQRQRDPWAGGASPAHQPPAVFTVWPHTQRDLRFIEITDTLPVMAFGETLPAVPPQDFMLPWVRTSKALKRSKRSKTLH